MFLFGVPAKPETRASPKTSSSQSQPASQNGAASLSAVVSSGVTVPPTSTRPHTTTTKKESRVRKAVPKTYRADNSANDDSVRQQKSSPFGDSSVRPDRDSPSVGGSKSAQRDDFSVDIRVAPRRTTRNEDVVHLNNDVHSLSLNEASWKDSPSVCRNNAEDLLQVSVLSLVVMNVSSSGE